MVGSLLVLGVARAHATDPGDVMGGNVSNYVARVMQGLKAVADGDPTPETFRDRMKAFMDATPGVFGASLIDTNFVIRQVYYKRDFLAVGYDLKRVGELDYFWKRMRQHPEAQVSEPGHGNLVQPRLVAMRYPILTANGSFKGIVSVMIHTEAFLKGVGLDHCRAYRIICLGKLAEEKGQLGTGFHEATVTLPATEWRLQFRE